ncbi:MAG: hypothetical protein JNJ45_06960 [Chthonomonas sp.]|nr:hypothetical protein [Chthonomonas sp.]
MQAQDLTFWQAAPGFNGKTLLGLFIGLAFFALCYFLPTQFRKYILWVIPFVCGSYYIFQYLLPDPIGRDPGELPRNTMEAVKFWLDDGATHVGRFSNVLTAFLIGLGTFSLVRLHVTRVRRKQENWSFSVVLLVSFLLMLTFGVWDYHLRELNPDLELMDNWAKLSGFNWLSVYGFDFLFDGMFQQMDATMFSIIAFFILSAAYRAFRIRSVESTVLLATALILILANMGAVAQLSTSMVERWTGGESSHLLNNLKLSEIAAWIRGTIQSGSLRAINFGIAVGALAMGLRLWLGLEKGTGN